MSLDSWSQSEKKISRAAFDLAYRRECDSIRKAAINMLNESSPESNAIWKLSDFLYDKRSESDNKYDYRYSQLVHVFGKLVFEKWLSLDELSGLNQEKVDKIKDLSEYLERP